MNKETKLEIEIINFIRSNNQYVIKNQASATTGKGRPDLSACIYGKYVAIELKTGDRNSRTTYSQFKHLRDVAQAGGLAFYVNDLESFKKLFTILRLNKLRKQNLKNLLFTKGQTLESFLKDLNRFIHTNSILRIGPHGEIERIEP